MGTEFPYMERDKEMLRQLSEGETQQELSKKFAVPRTRISQLKHLFYKNQHYLDIYPELFEAAEILPCGYSALRRLIITIEDYGLQSNWTIIDPHALDHIYGYGETTRKLLAKGQELCCDGVASDPDIPLDYELVLDLAMGPVKIPRPYTLNHVLDTVIKYFPNNWGSFTVISSTVTFRTDYSRGKLRNPKDANVEKYEGRQVVMVKRTTPECYGIPDPFLADYNVFLVSDTLSYSR